MPIENERKLLLDSNKAKELLAVLKQSTAHYNIEFFDITQGYLSNNARIRKKVSHVSGLDEFYFTYKKKIGHQTIELEQTISVHDYQKLFLIVKPVIVKTRVKIKDGDITWDVDFFKTPKQGNVYLTMAEAEMPEFETETPPVHPLLEPYALRWIDAGDKRFNNRQLANPKRVKNSLDAVSNADKKADQ
jgi:CYTH domain-containing protein